MAKKTRFTVHRSVYDTYSVYDTERELVCDGYYANKKTAQSVCRELNTLRRADPWGDDVLYCHKELTGEAIRAAHEMGKTR